MPPRSPSAPCQPAQARTAVRTTLVGIGVSVAFIAILKVSAVWFPANRFATLNGVTLWGAHNDQVLRMTVSIGVAPIVGELKDSSWWLRRADIAMYAAKNQHTGYELYRKEIDRRTIFNLLGPLSNPASVKRQLVGVFAADFATPMAEALRGWFRYMPISPIMVPGVNAAIRRRTPPASDSSIRISGSSTS